jgi:transcription elongation factor Elf1
MAIKYYRLNCEICGFNQVTDGSNIQLVEYKRSQIQKELPKIDPVTNKISHQRDMMKLPKKYKCPKCGRLVSARLFKEPEVENKTKSNYEQDFDTRGKGGFERL